MTSNSASRLSTRDLFTFVKSIMRERKTCSPRRCRHIPGPSRWKSRILVLGIALVTLTFLQFRFAIFETSMESDFRRAEFSYLSNFDDFAGVISDYKEHVELTNNYANFSPTPINLMFSEVPYLTEVKSISKKPVGLLIIVKSAAHNLKKRNVIRKTWGNSDYLLQTNISPDLPTKIVFILGTASTHEDNSQSILEANEHEDILLAQFKDTYDNNTFKTVLALRWAVKVVKDFKYLMFVDDDMYLSPTNVISLIKNIGDTNVIAMESNLTGVTFLSVGHFNKYHTVHSLNKVFSLRSKPLMMGDVNTDAAPFRNLIGLGSKWSISISEYAYNYFPPYVAGGATLFDKSTVTYLYYGSFFTKLLRIDDVYLGIVAYKLGLSLTHSNFMDSSYVENLRGRLKDKFDKMLSFHGLQCPEQLEEVWVNRSLNFTFNC